jgi:hypothetical protein
MQAVGLVTGDEFLLPYNLTVDADDVHVYIKELTWKWRKHSDDQDISFDDTHGIDFAEILGPTGFCYNFNLINSTELLYLDK